MWRKPAHLYSYDDRIVVINDCYSRNQKGKRATRLRSSQVLTVQRVDGRKLWIGQAQNEWIESSRVMPLGEAALDTIERRRKLQLVKRFWADGFYPDRFHTFLYLHGKANLLYYLKQYERALEIVNQAAALQPRMLMGYITRALILLALKKHREAIEDCNLALKLEPKSSLAYYYRSLAYRELEEFERSLEELNLAMEAGNPIPHDYSCRADLQLNLGKYSMALDDYNKSLEMDPLNKDACFGKASCLLYLGEFDLAKKELNTLRSLGKKYDQYAFHLGYALFAKLKFTDSLSEFDGLIGRGNHTRWNYYAAACSAMMLRQPDRLEDFIIAAESPGESQIELKGYAVLRGTLYARLMKQTDIEIRLSSVQLPVFGQAPDNDLRFVRGEIDEKELLALAVKDEDKLTAHFTVGLHHLINNQRSHAAECFKWIIQHSNDRFVEFTMAERELELLTDFASADVE